MSFLMLSKELLTICLRSCFKPCLNCSFSQRYIMITSYPIIGKHQQVALEVEITSFWPWSETYWVHICFKSEVNFGMITHIPLSILVIKPVKIFVFWRYKSSFSVLECLFIILVISLKSPYFRKQFINEPPVGRYKRYAILYRILIIFNRNKLYHLWFLGTEPFYFCWNKESCQYYGYY